MEYFGDFLEDATVLIPFNTFTSDDPAASATITNLADADIKVHKDGGTTQIATDGATVAIDYDTITGNHLVTIDTSAHADYSTGSEYAVRIEGTTVDGGTINAWIGCFSIENRSSSLSATALANLISQYDGTGLVGDEFPATQSQVGSIANVGSAVNRPAASYTLTTGTQSANTFAETEALDGVRHEHTDTAGAMDLYYEFAIGAGTPSAVQVTGYVTGGNDDMDVYGFDWVTSAWVQIGNIQGTGAATNAVHPFTMFVNMVGTGANSGVVRVRFFKTSGLTSATLAIDQIFVAFSQSALSVLDRIYFDSGASNTNTVPGTDGVPGNPVSTEAAVNTLLTKTNLRKVEVALDSSITFGTDHNDETWIGDHWTLLLGTRDVGGSHFVGADVTGIGTSAANNLDFANCEIGTCTLHPFHMSGCSYVGTITAGAVGNYSINPGHSDLAGGTTPIFDFGALLGNVNLIIGGWNNGIEIRNFNGTGTDLFSISGVGQIIYAASCSGSVEQRGEWRVTNTGGVTIVADDNTTGIDTIESAATEARLAELDAANMPTDLADALANTIAILADTAEIGVAGGGLTLLGGMSAGMKAEILSEINDALDAAIPELGVAQPTATPSIRTGIMLQYMALRNQFKTQTSGTDAIEVYNNAGTLITSKLISDDGSDYVEAKMS